MNGSSPDLVIVDELQHPSIATQLEAIRRGVKTGEIFAISAGRNIGKSMMRQAFIEELQLREAEDIKKPKRNGKRKRNPDRWK